MPAGRRQFLGVAGAGLAGAVAAPAVHAQSRPEIHWRCVSSFPKSLETLYGGAEHIARRVATATQNRFQIQLFGPGEIVPGLQVLDAVQNETIECAETASTFFAKSR